MGEVRDMEPHYITVEWPSSNNNLVSELFPTPFHKTHKIMTFKSFLLLILFFPVALIAQENYATVIFEKNSTEGDDELLYYVFNELGKVESGRVRNTPLKISARKDTLAYCYISNTLDLTSFFYFKAGDTIRIIQNENWDLQYAGSHEKEHQLIADLFNKNIITFRNTYEKAQDLGLRKSLPYVENLYNRGLQVVDSFLVANPGADKSIIEMIKIDLRYKIFGNPLLFYYFQEYSDENFNLYLPFIENELNEIKNFTHKYNYGGTYSYFYLNLSKTLYFNFSKDKLLYPHEKGYAYQIRDMLNYFLTLPDFMRETAIYLTLADFFNFNIFEDIDIKEFTAPFYQVAHNPQRIQKVQEWDEHYSYLQNVNHQADYIIRDQTIRETTLEKLDGNVTTIGDFFDSLKDTPIYLDVWATWCAPCRLEMNKLNAEFFKEKAARMVYLSIDEDKDKWKSVTQDNYLFDNEVEHYHLKVNDTVLERLLDGYVTIPKYIFINAYQSELYKDVLRPTQFDWSRGYE